MTKQDQLTSVIFASRADRVAPLLSRGANVEDPDKYGNTPLYLAAVQGETEIVRILLAAGADPNKESFAEDQGAPLCAAAAWGHTDIVRLLLEGGADPNLVERGPMTALIWARQNKHTDTEQALLSAGADPDLDPR